MTLKELRYAVAVAAELHFGRAAAKCAWRSGFSRPDAIDVITESVTGMNRGAAKAGNRVACRPS